MHTTTTQSKPNLGTTQTSQNLRVHHYALSEGIRPSPEFAKKGLAEFAVNVGTKCGHDCAYCSSGAVLRCHPSFQQFGESPFKNGYAIVDPNTPERVERDAKSKAARGRVQLCTTTDAWAPEAITLGLGRKCLAALLNEPEWKVRILTKNAGVCNDFDLLQEHRGRVSVGLSLTAPASKSKIIQAVEPNASSIQDRMDALALAHKMGLRTYGMLCPLLPGVASAPAHVQELVDFVLGCGAEEIFVEPVNARGPGLKATQAALERAGFTAEATAVGKIRKGSCWSAYVVVLLQNVQQALTKRGALHKLKFLLYPARLTSADLAWAQAHGQGVVWL